MNATNNTSVDVTVRNTTNIKPYFDKVLAKYGYEPDEEPFEPDFDYYELVIEILDDEMARARDIYAALSICRDIEEFVSMFGHGDLIQEKFNLDYEERGRNLVLPCFDDTQYDDLETLVLYDDQNYIEFSPETQKFSIYGRADEGYGVYQD